MNAKEGMRALSLLLIVALAGAMFVPVVSASTSVNEQLNSTITLDYAKKIAQLHLNDVSEGMS